MDILGMLNDFIKDNKTDEQLAAEFIKLLNKGQSIEHIAKLYEVTPQRITEVIKKARNKNGTTTQLNNNTNPSFNKNNNNKTDEQLSKDFLYLLYGGMTLDEIAIQHNTPFEKVKEILINTGFKHMVTSDEKKNIKPGQQALNALKYTKTDEQLADHLAILLNNKGKSIEKVAEMHNLSKDKVKDILTSAGYTFYGFSKKWKKSDSTNKSSRSSNNISINKTNNKSNKSSRNFTNNIVKLTEEISEIINKLNNGISILEVAVWHKISEDDLRQLLKREKYRYDRFFKVWTNLSRQENLKRVADDLYNGKYTLKDLERKGVNITVVDEDLLKSGYAYKNPKKTIVSTKVSTNNFTQNNGLDKQFNNNTKGGKHPLITEEMLIQEEFEEKISKTLVSEIKAPTTSEIKELFNEDEISTLKEIINSWKQKQEEEVTAKDVKVETTILISSDLLSLLSRASEQEGISRSLIIEKALKAYLI